MAKIPAFAITIIVIFSALLFVIYIPGFVMPEGIVDALKDFAAVLGLISLVVTSIWAYRKKLWNEGFEKFKTDYNILQQSIRIEIDDFKSDVRGYVKDNETYRRDALNRIVDLYVDISKKISDQNKVWELTKATKPFIEQQEKDWKHRIEDDLDTMKEKISHIADCVNGKKQT